MDKPVVLPVDVEAAYLMLERFETIRAPTLIGDALRDALAREFAVDLAKHRISSQARPDGELVEHLSNAAAWLERAQSTMWTQTEKTEDRVKAAQRELAKAIAALSSERIAPQPDTNTMGPFINKPPAGYEPLGTGERAQPLSLATVKEIAAKVVQDACETDPADPEHPDTISITTGDLETIVRAAVEDHLTSLTPSKEGE